MIPLLIDSSALIDGRLLDLARIGMIDAPVILPRYVIDELQSLSDSEDRLKRERGRRGLDAVRELQEAYPETKLMDVPASSEDVDRRLVETAGLEGYRILTTDMGLTKIARIQGLDVLNLNEVSKAILGTVAPGAIIETEIVRAGESKGQGIAYLPDGAMIVVENAEKAIGTTCEIEITNTIQRAGGKLIFGKLRAGHKHEAAKATQTLADAATRQPPDPSSENATILPTRAPSFRAIPRRSR